MSHLQVLREVERRGLRLTVDGADLRLAGPKERIDADLVGRIRSHKADLLAHLAAPAGAELTGLQRAYLIGRGASVEIGNVASHVFHEIEGHWDVPALESALRTVVARHGVLRTRFTPDGRAIEQDTADVRIGVLDLRGAGAAAQRERLAALREQRSHRMLPVQTAPLLAADVTIRSDDAMVLHVGHDGLVLDGISMFLFFRYWWQAYRAATAGEPDPQDGIEQASFPAYVAELRAARDRAPARRSRTHWLARLDGLPSHPDLPLAAAPSTITETHFDQHTARLDRESWTALKERASAAGVTPTVLLLAAYAETLSCWGAGRRFTLNTTVANRPPIHPRIADALGNFGETMLVEVDADPAASFADRARALHAELRRDLDHRHFSGIEVLRELTRRRGAAGARMPYTFNSTLGYDVDGSTLELFGPETATSSQTPQVWLNGFAFEQHGGVVVQFDAVRGLFPDGLVADLVAGYRTLLDRLRDEPAWSERTFDLLPPRQRSRRREANDTATPDPVTGMLTEAFLAREREAPDAPAVITGQGAVSYRQLRRHAAAAATWLRGHDVGRDEPVGLVMRRGPEQIAGILAALLAGGAYLPIDAALPAERRDVILRDAGVRCLLTNAAPAGLPAGVAVRTVDASQPAPEDATEPPPLPGADPDDLAYLLYTSGTTGTPKGVMVSHRSVRNVVDDCAARFGIGPTDRFFGISAFTFDLSAWDVFGALSAGAAVVLPDADRAADPEHWLALCAGAGVTVWNSVPAIVAMLHEAASADPDAVAALRLVMMSGDRIPAALPPALRKLSGRIRLVSLGGPTETTIWNVQHPIGPESDGTRTVPYGRPNANNRAYLLDAEGRDTPDWVAGEICAAGTGLARGYLGDPARTAEKFTTDTARGERLYRTGDLGRYLPDGSIEILGRTDFQIKVNGYRIEAGEVETRLVAMDGVAQAAVVRQPGPRGDRLAAHLVPAGGAAPSEADVRAALRRQLPEYMVPTVVRWHPDGLPLTGNNKVDRAALSASDTQDRDGDTAAPDTALERQVADLWRDVLGVADVGVQHVLYELGGDSIAAARILAGVRKRFGITITLDKLPDVETVRKMAARIGAERAR